MDLGGIIDHTEQLIGGLQDLGHEVHLNEFIWANQVHDQRKEADWSYGPSGIPHHQGKGWNFDRRYRIPYKGNANLQGARQIIAQFDLVIWTVPVPSKNKNNMGNADWVELYELINTEAKQIAFIHDGNAKKGAGHILAIQEHLDGLACVHPCALNGASFADVPRTLVLNPQEDPTRCFQAEWNHKSEGFVNMQTFKAWKHVHELVEAIRYMPLKEETELREIAGLGIEYRYMNSPDKCKEAYFHADGKKFWDAALGNGLIHYDYWDKKEVNDMLDEARILVDPSWSNNYSKIGGHFNRVVVDAMMQGCVPVARAKGMGDEIFQSGRHYIEIPVDVDAQQYADIIMDAGNMDRVLAEAFISENNDRLHLFDRKRIAQQVIDLAHGDLETEDVQGTATVAFTDKVEDTLFNHFGVI